MNKQKIVYGIMFLIFATIFISIAFWHWEMKDDYHEICRELGYDVTVGWGRPSWKVFELMGADPEPYVLCHKIEGAKIYLNDTEKNGNKEN